MRFRLIEDKNILNEKLDLYKCTWEDKEGELFDFYVYLNDLNVDLENHTLTNDGFKRINTLLLNRTRETSKYNSIWNAAYNIYKDPGSKFKSIDKAKDYSPSIANMIINNLYGSKRGLERSKEIRDNLPNIKSDWYKHHIDGNEHNDIPENVVLIPYNKSNGIALPNAIHIILHLMDLNVENPSHDEEIYMWDTITKSYVKKVFHVEIK